MGYYAINRLMDNLRIRVPGAVDAAMKLELFNALDQFLSGSNTWRGHIPFEVTQGQTTYDIMPDTGSTIVRLMNVQSNGYETGAAMPTPGVIVLASLPSDAGTYTAEVALTITDPVTRDDYPVVPEWIWDRYGADLLDGAMALLFAQIAKPYSNERMAIFHMRKFTDAISRARVNSNRQHTYSAQRWRFPQTFAVRRQ